MGVSQFYKNCFHHILTDHMDPFLLQVVMSSPIPILPNWTGSNLWKGNHGCRFTMLSGESDPNSTLNVNITLC